MTAFNKPAHQTHICILALPRPFPSPTSLLLSHPRMGSHLAPHYKHLLPIMALFKATAAPLDLPPPFCVGPTGSFTGQWRSYHPDASFASGVAPQNASSAPLQPCVSESPRREISTGVTDLHRRGTAAHNTDGLLWPSFGGKKAAGRHHAATVNLVMALCPTLCAVKVALY